MVFSASFSYIVAVSVIGGGNRSTRREKTDLSQVTDKFERVRTHNFSGVRDRLRM